MHEPHPSSKAADPGSRVPGLITRHMLAQVLPREAEIEPSHFLFIASRGALFWVWDQGNDHPTGPGGIAAYIDSLARGLMGLGDTIKLLAVVRADEKEQRGSLEGFEAWTVPFELALDRKPDNWLGRKATSFLEILRCLSPRCRRLLEKASFFEASRVSSARLEKILSAEKPTAVVFGHLDTDFYAMVLTLIERRIPYGIIAHGAEIGRLPNDKKNEFVKRGVMLKGAEWIAANSHHTKMLLENWGIASRKITILHPPISEEVLQESAKFGPVSSTGGELGLVTICRLVRQKGIDIVLRALKILAARGIPFRYVIGGDGPERTALEALVEETGLRGKVHFQGQVTGGVKCRMLRENDVFVMPSRGELEIQQEGFGIAFMEAAAFGLPAIGSKTGGIPDAVVDGQTGILVPAESPEALADALTYLYQEPEIRKAMGSTARERARRDFSPKAIAIRFRDAFTK